MAERDLYLPEAAAEGRLSSAGPAIRVSNVAKSFALQEVLHDVSFELERGKVYSILGPSGCGKSTLLKAMIGAQRPDHGVVEIDGVDVWKGGERARARARRKFGVLFQSGALLNGLTCGENVALPLRRHTDLPDSTIDMIVRMKLELVGMGHAIDKRPPELSGGMKKRCALARAIALDPAIVFYDEPSAGIDPVMIAVLDHLILDLSSKLGITSVVITHEIPSALRISDEMLMLWKGVVHFRGTPQEFQASRDPAVYQFVHGSDDGPLSQSTSKAAIAARILGIEESELFDRSTDSAHERGAAAFEEERQRRSRTQSERYKAVSDTIFKDAGEIRKRHTRQIQRRADEQHTQFTNTIEQEYLERMEQSRESFASKLPDPLASGDSAEPASELAQDPPKSAFDDPRSALFSSSQKAEAEGDPAQAEDSRQRDQTAEGDANAQDEASAPADDQDHGSQSEPT